MVTLQERVLSSYPVQQAERMKIKIDLFYLLMSFVSVAFEIKYLTLGLKMPKQETLW